VTPSGAEVDVLMASDFRFPGGTTASVVEETLAQGRAGYRTGLLHMPSPIQRAAVPFAPRIRRLVESGEADLVLSQRPRAKTLVIRHPSVLSVPPEELPRVTAEKVVIVVNQVPTDPRARTPYYDVAACHAAAWQMTGVEPVWAPIGPQVRAALAPYAGQVPIRDEDWTNIVDVDAWYVPRKGFVADRPVIGRHSRGHWAKWPADRRTLLAAYPDNTRYLVKVMGGTEAPRDILGRLPSNWRDLPFNSMPPAEFLQSIDFLVYYHHPDLIEAFGRTVLEGLAAGAVAVVDPIFAETFGAACRYAPISQALQVVDELSADFSAYQDQSERGVAEVRKRFSYEAHTARIAELIGPSENSPPRPRLPATTGADGLARPVPETTVVLDLRTEGESETEMLTAVLVEAGTTGPVAALVPAQHAVVAAAAGALVETIPAVADELTESEHNRYLSSRVQGVLDVYGDGAAIVILGSRERLSGVSLAERQVWVVDRSAGPSSDDESPRVLPEPWSMKRLSAPSKELVVLDRGKLRSPVARAQRSLNLLRQRAPHWLIKFGSAAKRSLYDAQRKAIERLAPGALVMVGERGPQLPAPTPVVSTRRPIALFVAADEELDAEQTLQAITQRAILSNGFQLALLAPPHWVAPAARYGLAIETVVPQSRWPEAYTIGWSDYRRRRAVEVARAFQPAVAVTLTPDDTNPHRPGPDALDLAEAIGSGRSTWPTPSRQRMR